MSRNLDIKKEIERYYKSNYSKRIAIQRLLEEGFTQEEINEHIAIFNHVDTDYFDTLSYFFPGLVFLIMVFMATVYSAYDFNNYLLKFLFITIAASIIYIIKLYYQNKTIAKLITLVLTILSLAAILYLYVSHSIKLVPFVVFISFNTLILLSVFKSLKIKNTTIKNQ